MGITFELIDAPYPYLCAVYRCRCGAVEVRHADEAAVAPPGWQTAEEPEGECRCPRCARPADPADER